MYVNDVIDCVLMCIHTACHYSLVFFYLTAAKRHAPTHTQSDPDGPIELTPLTELVLVDSKQNAVLIQNITKLRSTVVIGYTRLFGKDETRVYINSPQSS